MTPMNRARGDAGKNRFVHNEKNVHRITLTAERARQKSKVIGEGHDGGKHRFESEDALFGIEGELVWAAAGGKDDLEEYVLSVGRRRVGSARDFIVGFSLSVRFAGRRALG
jgi:hypothetical protein